MRAERAKLSRHADVAKAMDYMLKLWSAFERVVHDGRICLANNAAERSLRGIALGRKAWLFAGSVRGGEPAVVMCTLIQTAPASMASTRKRGWPMCSRASTNTPRAIVMPRCRHSACRRRLTRPIYRNQNACGPGRMLNLSLGGGSKNGLGHGLGSA